MSVCIFCQNEISGDFCPHCSFSQKGREHLPGTLYFGSSLRDYVISDVTELDGESTSYMAYDRLNRRRVVIKEFLPVSIIGPRDGDTVTIQTGKEVLFKNLMMDFDDLYRTLKDLDDPATRKVREVFSANGTVYAVLENLKGENLRQRMISNGKTYSFKEARWLFQPLFNLIARLEDLNLSHNGISDENIMVDYDGNVKLTGFAIQDLRVKNDHIKFKLYEGFSAPEQYSQNRFSGLYTDIYSIAASLYFAVTGVKYSSESLAPRGEDTALFPDYAVRALKRALEADPRKRLGKISDFVALLDNKTDDITMTATRPLKTRPVRIEDEKLFGFLDKRYLPVILGALIIILFFTAVISFAGRGESSSAEESSSVEVIVEKRAPYLVGMNYLDVIDQEEYAEFDIEVSEEWSDEIPTGQIMKQNPDAGTVMKEDTDIYITVSKGPHIAQVPYGMIGMDIDAAREMLNDQEIEYEIQYVTQTETYRFGMVTGTDKPAGTSFNAGKEKLILYVADNTPIPPPPSSSTRPPASSETPPAPSDDTGGEDEPAGEEAPPEGEGGNGEENGGE